MNEEKSSMNYQQEKETESQKRGMPKAIKILIGLFFSVLSAVCLCAMVWGFSLDSTVIGAHKTEVMSFDLHGKLATFVNNSVSDALGDLTYIRKIYSIDRLATVAPAPDNRYFGEVSINDAEKVLEVIERARDYGLLDDQDVIFDPSTDLYWDSNIQYYCDETILVICWKELIDGRVCSCVEVKIADGSQIRRKLVNDTYGSGERAYASDLAKSCNAVVAMNADFYAFRNLGVTVYQGKLYRYETTCDVLLIDGNGDFHFLRREDLHGREAVEQYIKENDIQFSMAFGPVLVQDGELQLLRDNYSGLGEMHEEYSRAGIAQYDKLHYLYMTVSFSKDSTPRAKINEFARIMHSKNVQQAYNFDGGQTGEVVFRGAPYNHVDFGFERSVSDIIYFATAFPEKEVRQ